MDLMQQLHNSVLRPVRKSEYAHIQMTWRIALAVLSGANNVVNRQRVISGDVCSTPMRSEFSHPSSFPFSDNFSKRQCLFT